LSNFIDVLDYTSSVLYLLFTAFTYLFYQKEKQKQKQKENLLFISCYLLTLQNFENAQVYSLFVQNDYFPLFIIDSGCSQPMCRERDAFNDLQPNRTPIRLANNSIIFTQGIGTIGRFKNVYYVPELHFNLMSVSYLIQMGFEITFQKSGLVILTDSFGKQEIFGQRKEGLFVSTSKPTPFACMSTISPSSHLNRLIHNRLCHINDQYIQIAISKKFITGVPVTKVSHRPFCDACALSKTHRISSSNTPGSSHKRKFSKVVTVPNSSNSDNDHQPWNYHPLRSFSVDIKGPLTTSFQNFKYILMFTCRHTSYRFVYFLKEKSDTVHKMQEFILSVRKLGKNVTQMDFDQESNILQSIQQNEASKDFFTSRNIDTTFTDLRSDNGGEFINEEMRDLLNEEAITHTTTSPHTPHQNGIAERSNRTIIELAVTILVDAKVQLNLWPWAVRHVIQISNMLPNKRLKLQSTPYLEIFDAVPDLSHIRIFGSDAYMWLPDSTRPTLGPKAVKGILLGVDYPNSLAYLVFHNNRIYKTGHLQINEDLSMKRNQAESYFHQFQLLPMNDNHVPPSHITPQLDPSSSSSSSTSLVRSVTKESVEGLPSPGQPNNEAVRFNDDDSHSSTETIAFPGSRTRSKLKALYTDRCNFTLQDSQNSILSGKYYDQFYNESYISCPLQSCFNVGSLSYEEVQLSSEWSQWKQAIHEEISKLTAINTWSVVQHLPANKKALNFKWVLKKKQDITGKNIFKARLTVKGCAQKEFVDFDEVWAGVVKIITFRLFLSFFGTKNFASLQLDVQSAFPQAPLETDEEIFMRPPSELNLPSNCFLKLHRALYGLKQASRAWSIHLNRFLIELGFTQLKTESCVFIKRQNFIFMLLLVYVDDMIIFSSSQDSLNWFQKEFSKSFAIKTSPLKICLGFEIFKNPSLQQISISKVDYSLKIVQRFHSFIQQIRFRSSPLDENVKLSKNDSPKSEIEREAMAQLPYRQIIGALNYLACSCRPDISFSVNYLARFMTDYGHAHWLQLLNVLAYVRDHPYSYLIYKQTPQKTFSMDNQNFVMLRDHIYCFVDADLASTDLDTRRSTSGYVIFFNDAPIAWKSVLQKTVSSSSTEAELKALHEAAKEVVWLSNLLVEIGEPHKGPIIIFEDNTSCMRATDNNVEHSKLKHIEIKYHQMREFIEKGLLCTIHIASAQQIADVLTKPLVHYNHQYFTLQMQHILRSEIYRNYNGNYHK